jgi:hypothetical protein
MMEMKLEYPDGVAAQDSKLPEDESAALRPANYFPTINTSN